MENYITDIDALLDQIEKEDSERQDNESADDKENVDVGRSSFHIASRSTEEFSDSPEKSKEAWNDLHIPSDISENLAFIPSGNMSASSQPPSENSSIRDKIPSSEMCVQDAEPTKETSGTHPEKDSDELIDGQNQCDLSDLDPRQPLSNDHAIIVSENVDYLVLQNEDPVYSAGQLDDTGPRNEPTIEQAASTNTESYSADTPEELNSDAIIHLQEGSFDDPYGYSDMSASLEDRPTLPSASAGDDVCPTESFHSLVVEGPEAYCESETNSERDMGQQESTASLESTPHASEDLQSDSEKEELTGATIIPNQAWNNIEEISDAQLDEFLSSLDPLGSNSELHQEPSDSDAYGTTSLEASTDLDESYNSSDYEPVQMSPPIPMSLVDVSDEILDSEMTNLEADEIPSTSNHSIDISSIPSVASSSSSAFLMTDEIPTSSRASSEIETSSSSSYAPVEEEVIPNAEDPNSGMNTSSSSLEEGTGSGCYEPVIFTADNLGKVKPSWVPDEMAPICMLCGSRFTIMKRRHHCRACGSVICATCGNYKAKLEYLDNKEDRVCALCNDTFLYKSGSVPADFAEAGGESEQGLLSPSPVVVESVSLRPPPKGLLKKPNRERNPQQRNVVFFDGIRPGGDLMESEFHGNGRRMALMNARRQRRSPGAASDATPPKTKNSPRRASSSHIVRVFVNREVFPVLDLTHDGHFVLHDTPDVQLLRDKFSGCPSEPVDFFVNACLRVSVQLVELKCCTGQIAWCYTTSGMRLVGQDEVVILVVRESVDVLPPRDILVHLNEVFLHAKEGRTIGALGHSTVGLSGYRDGFLGSRQNAGFLFVRRTFQCLSNIRLPEPPYLFGILMTKWEVPWAKLFPLRLMVRLGAEFRQYPCPLVNVRSRKPVYEEVGHTLMNLLCDFRNFQYHLPCVEDSECCMSKGTIVVRFAKHKYDQVMKACQSSNDNVLPIGMDFSRSADASLVCVQNLDNGQYDTQAISLEKSERKVTGANFIIFNASLKSNNPSECRATVVEDGIMAQITLKGLQDLKTALAEQRSFSFTFAADSKDGSFNNQDAVTIEWVDVPKSCNIGVKSPIDGKDLSGIESRRVTLKHSSDFVNGTLSVRCTEVFLNDESPLNAVHREELDLSRLAENLAMATCSVLRNHLYDYRDNGTTKIGLRVCLGPDLVEYELGSKGDRFSPEALAEYDDKIMPILLQCSRVWNDRARLDMELLFRIFQH